jgi:glycine/D-amino acid oxidase-like deaminating enzyme
LKREANGQAMNTRGSAPDVVIIGGGIVGTAAAAFLARAGARVTLHDGEGLASGASGANSGAVQYPLDPVLVPLYLETVELYRDLTAADAGFRLLFVSRHGDVVRDRARALALSDPVLRPEVLEGSALQALEPALAPGLTGCRVVAGYPVPPSASTYAYATLAERHGATIRVGKPATPEVVNGRCVGVRVDGRVVPADVVLVAAGPWTSALIDPTGRWRPIRPVWGVVVETELASPPRHVLEEAEIDAAIGIAEAASDGTSGTSGAAPSATTADAPGAFTGAEFSLVTAGGVSAVGSTFLEGEPDPASWVVPLLERGSRFVPGLADAAIRGVRACARPMAEDRRPLIGAVPGIAGLYICAGHGPWGISTGPASARLVADLIVGRPVVVPPPLDAARFGRPVDWSSGDRLRS